MDWSTLFSTLLVIVFVFLMLRGCGGMTAGGGCDMHTESGPRMLPESEQPEAVRAVMRVDVATEQPDGTRTFRGRLRAPAETASPTMMVGTSVGSSILFALLAKLSLGSALEYGHASVSVRWPSQDGWG